MHPTNTQNTLIHADVRAAQAPLRAAYVTHPDAAQVIDRARTGHGDAQDPFHTRVEPMPGCDVQVPIGVHRALGGPHDAPTPGDLLCAALAACADSTIRMTANILGVELAHLEVRVAADVDVRGTLLVDRNTPVGFQAMRCDVDLVPVAGTDPRLVTRLQALAEHSCVVLQTLRQPPPVAIGFSNPAGKSALQDPAANDAPRSRSYPAAAG